MKKIFILLIIVFPLSQTLFAQNKKAYEQKAAETFEQGDYSAALANYLILLDIDSNRIDALYGAATSARLIDAFEVAEKNYREVLKHPQKDAFPETLFWLADVKKSLGKYTEALDTFQLYADYAGATEALKNRAIIEADYCEWAIELISNPDSIDFKHFGNEINTVYSDFGPIWQNDALYYTSAFRLDEDEDPVLRVFRHDEGSTVSNPLQMDLPEKDLHTAHFVESPVSGRKYINLCNQESPTRFSCRLYYFAGTVDGKQQLLPLPPPINLDSFTNTQPSVGKDQAGNEVLYFVSDRPGGQGGLDIWFTTLMPDGTYSEPSNLAIVNSPGNDISPFFHFSSSTLFFSSDGRRGLGGLDVFYSTWSRENDWSIPEHTGYPLNSSYDDLYFSFSSDRATSYFTSNRPGCMCASEDKDCKCNDIYAYPIEVKLIASTYNIANNSKLNGATVRLIDMETGAELSRVPNFAGNEFPFELALDKNYMVIAEKEGWLPDSAQVSTQGFFKSKTLLKALYLTPVIRLEVYTFDAITKEPLTGVAVKLTDSKSARIVEKINTAGNDFYYTLYEGVLWQIEGYKEFFQEDKSTVNTSGIFEPAILRDSLYLMPFGDLPLVLYFDNDHPNPRTLQTTTLLNYGQTFEAYFARKKTFKEQFTQNLEGQAKDASEKRIEDFFENEVKRNYDRLNSFCGLIQSYLEKGNEFEIILEGFASPLANSDYNKNLTARRIKSVVNHLAAHNKGVLKNYLDNGQLKIKELPHGEEQSSKDVSGDPKNRRMSVYSVDASQERKVRIIDIRRFEKLSLTEKKMPAQGR